MKKLLTLALIVILAVFISTPFSSVSAGVNCRGTCHGCGPRANGDSESCSSGDDGAEEVCCYDASCNGHCSKDSNAPCGNCDYFCDKPPECQCTPVSCPPGNEGNKYITRTQSNGDGRTCGDPCNPNTFACPVSHFNAPPTCSILPPSITITRGDLPKSFNLTASDADYGDTVEVTLVAVKNTAGDLNSCVDVIRTQAGGSLAGAVVRSGTDNPAAITQTTTFYVDARTARGIYENINGQSICQGTITVAIRDIDSDGVGGIDVSDTAECKVGITVINEAPQLSDVVISDQDAKSYGRDMGAANDGNLVDGRDVLFVGSSLLSNTNKARASLCGEPMTLIDPILCPMGGENDKLSFSQRRNPLKLEFTVSDGNGLADLMQAGVWIQRSSLNRDKVALPEINASGRNSFHLKYSESEISQLMPPANQLYCFKSGAAAPVLLNVANCPLDCAACAKKEGVYAVANNPNALRFKIGLYFNDRDDNDGMIDDEYSVFLSALDKVSAPFYQVKNRGADGWIKFTKNGVACLGASCPGNSDFSLLYDSVAPKATYISWQPIDTTKISAKFTISDNTGGSGLAGVTNRFIAKQPTLDNEPLGDRTWATRVSDGQPFDGSNDRIAPVGGSIELLGDGLDPNGGEEIVAGLCVYDRAGNMSCRKNPQTYVYLAPWIKTSYGDIYSARNGNAPFSQSIPSESGTTLDNVKSLYTPFVKQSFTVGTGLVMTGATQGIGISGGHLQGSINTPIGFEGNYRIESSSNYNVFSFNPFSPGNEYERLRASALLNCDLINTAESGVINCRNSGGLANIGDKLFNIIYLNNVGQVGNIVCSRTNVIFVTGALTIKGTVTKDTSHNDSGCAFVLANGATLTIDDDPSDTRKYANTPPATGELGTPTTDKFDAAVIANSGASILIKKGARGGSSKSTDRLEINGWVYSANTLPLFKRELAPVDNRRYPSEYIIYDAKLLDLFRPLLGVEKTVDLTCGTSEHVLCTTTN